MARPSSPVSASTELAISAHMRWRLALSAFLVWRSASSAVHGIGLTSLLSNSLPTFTNGRGSDHDGPIRHANPGRHTHTEALHRPVATHRRDIPRPPLAVALRQRDAEPRKSQERRGATPQQ